jgi:hypothetical protein
MKRKVTFLKILLLLFIVKTQGQVQEIDAPFYYQISGLVFVYDYDIATKTQNTTFKTPLPPLKFKIVKKEKNAAGNYDFYIIKFLTITNDDVTISGQKASLKDNSKFINSTDNEKYYWIKQDELDNQITQKEVVKSYKLTLRPAYGANVSLPFKLRPKTDGQNSRLTPDITLGGYLGARWRISRKEPFYVTVPIVTLGLATLPISDQTDGSNPDKGDGMVLGTTFSLGTVFQLNDFQFGFLMGWDHATGELGKNWIYNGKTWYSFSIGFSFLGNKKGPEEKK